MKIGQMKQFARLAFEYKVVSPIKKHIFNPPLNKISSAKASLLQKAVSTVAIASLTVLTLGAYGVYAAKGLSTRKAYSLQRELEKAIENNDLEKVKKLFKKAPGLKKSINGVIDEQGVTRGVPLFLPLALRTKNPAMVEFLIKNGADVNKSGRDGDIPVVATAKLRNLEMLKMLLKHGAVFEKFELNQAFMQTILNPRSKESPVEILEFLIEKGADVNHNGYIYSPLGRLAAFQKTGVLESVKLLLNKGAKLYAEEDSKLVKYLSPEIRDLIKSYNAHNDLF